MRRAVPGGAAQEPAVAVISYDEKPGIQAIGAVAPDLRPVPGTHPTISRDHEYKRHGTVTLMAGIDLLTGQVRAFVKDRHRSREFIEFLNMLDAAYPTGTAIKIILDNHSAHVSQETKAWLAARPEGRFQFVFTPNTALGSISSRGSSPKPPAPCFATSASAQNTSSNNASWSSSMISTATRSSTDGTIKSIPPHDP